jgi:hypothetical protein
MVHSTKSLPLEDCHDCDYVSYENNHHQYMFNGAFIRAAVFEVCWALPLIAKVLR